MPYLVCTYCRSKFELCPSNIQINMLVEEERRFPLQNLSSRKAIPNLIKRRMRNRVDFQWGNERLKNTKKIQSIEKSKLKH